MHNCGTAYPCSSNHGRSSARPAADSTTSSRKYPALKQILMAGCTLAMVLSAGGVAAVAPAAKAAKATGGAQGFDPLERRAIASLKQTIDAMAIPYDQFTLPNGLRVFAVPDSGAATVNVSVWYDVGAKSEPVGRSGFAHLFEHLMFNGSEHVPGDYMLPLMQFGAEVNGNTSIDRTNYYEVVPPALLDRALFMEADRMGHLLGAIGQGVLDEQRGVVQNEKRNSDDNPSSITNYRVPDILYGPKHPYGHQVIGSMADLRAADLGDVKAWFRDHYGPNNAVLVLSGKTTLAEAKPKIEKYFGSIPRGPQNRNPLIVPKPLAKTVHETLTAPVENVIVYRYWQVPGLTDPQSIALDGIMAVMNDDETGLRRRLVEDRQLFDSVYAMNSTSMQAGEFSINGKVHAGVDVKVATAALDAEIASYLSSKVDPAILARLAATQVYQTAQGMKRAASRGGIMGESVIAQGNPLAFQENLRRYVSLTPAVVLATARKWLLQPRYELTLVPGPRITPKDDIGADSNVVAGGASAPAPGPAAPAPAVAPPAADTVLPAVGAPQDPTFPNLQYATLRNGIKVRYAPVTDPLYTSVQVTIEGGQLHLPPSEVLLAKTMYGQMSEAFAGHDRQWVSRHTDLLGLSIGAGIGQERGRIQMTSPNANLPVAMTMLTGALTSPDFSVRDIMRVKRDLAERPKFYRTNAEWLADHVFKNLVDTGAPMTRREQVSTPEEIQSLTHENLLAIYRRLVRPERASITVVSSKPLAELLPLLDKTLGSWTQTGSAAPLPPLTYVPAPATPQIVIVDMPDAVQSTVIGGQWVDMDDRGADELIYMANRALGGGFTSRLNMNLREDKHWSYGASARFDLGRFGSTYAFESEIQPDKVGAAIGEVRKEVRDITGSKAITAREFGEIVTSTLGNAASVYEDPTSVMSALSSATDAGRPDTYPAETAKRLRETTLADANMLLKKNLDVDKWVWVIAGNASLIKPQLTGLGLPIKVVKPADIVPS